MTSNPLVYVIPPDDDQPIDPNTLNARLISLRQEYDIIKRSQPTLSSSNLSEEELAELHKSHSARCISMIREQIDIIAKLRRTASTSGPAKAGGKRAKKAPIDMSHLLAD